MMALFFGFHSLAIIYTLPMAALGVLLIFAGAQLTLTLLDMQTRKDLFVPIIVLGTTLASNLAAGFLTGIAVAYLLKWKRLSI
jgi:SulP family sulfate permease